MPYLYTCYLSVPTMGDIISKIVVLSSLLDSGKLTQEEPTGLKADLLQGTPVESPASFLIPPSSVTSTSTPKSTSLKRPSSVLEQPWTSLLDFGVTKKVKDSSGVLWNVVPPKDILPTQKASRQ